MTEKKGVGVYVGRFQVVELNPVHLRLMKQLLDAHQKVVVFVCSNPAPGDHNPIDWPFRADMFDEQYGEEVLVLEMPDTPDDRIWSQELDRRIMELRPEGGVTIHGTAAGVTTRYSGRYETKVLEADESDIPELMGLEQEWDMVSLRAGMLLASMRRFPTVYPTVDVAVFDEEKQTFLLARKDNELKWRFPGGFADPSDANYEFAAIRELYEECGEVRVEDFVYIGSTLIDDWRYRDSIDKIITHLYICSYVEGTAVANDDIAEVKWWELSRLTPDHFVYEHRPLFEMLQNFIDELQEDLEEDDEEEDEDFDDKF
jgi:bifunctional NMN adenylyltransferase/nudix hydrolase